MVTQISFLGADSGKVVIWNMAPIVDKKAEFDENIPKMLCQMDNHEGSINKNSIEIVLLIKQSCNYFFYFNLFSLCQLCSLEPFWTVSGLWG